MDPNKLDGIRTTRTRPKWKTHTNSRRYITLYGQLHSIVICKNKNITYYTTLSADVDIKIEHRFDNRVL